MPKLYCTCGYVHNLSFIPDDGFITVKDKDYEQLIEAEQIRNDLSSAKQGTSEWEKLLSCDRVVSAVTERLYECPECGRLIWKRNDSNTYIYCIADKFTLYDDLELSAGDVQNIRNNKQLTEVIDRLVNSWCNRKCLRTLRYVLEGWPMAGGLTDDWGQLHTALRHIVGSARNELTRDEIELVEGCIRYIDKLVYRA